MIHITSQGISCLSPVTDGRPAPLCPVPFIVVYIFLFFRKIPPPFLKCIAQNQPTKKPTALMDFLVPPLHPPQLPSPFICFNVSYVYPWFFCVHALHMIGHPYTTTNNCHGGFGWARLSLLPWLAQLCFHHCHFRLCSGFPHQAAHCWMTKGIFSLDKDCFPRKIAVLPVLHTASGGFALTVMMNGCSRCCTSSSLPSTTSSLSST
jgi:hypothetical protein